VNYSLGSPKKLAKFLRVKLSHLPLPFGVNPLSRSHRFNAARVSGIKRWG
jgi:hypothetical protein